MKESRLMRLYDHVQCQPISNNGIKNVQKHSFIAWAVLQATFNHFLSIMLKGVRKIRDILDVTVANKMTQVLNSGFTLHSCQNIFTR